MTVCLFVCMYVSNTSQHDWTDQVQILTATHKSTGKAFGLGKYVDVYNPRTFEHA